MSNLTTIEIVVDGFLFSRGEVQTSVPSPSARHCPPERAENADDSVGKRDVNYIENVYYLPTGTGNVVVEVVVVQELVVGEQTPLDHELLMGRVRQGRSADRAHRGRREHVLHEQQPALRAVKDVQRADQDPGHVAD